MYLLDTNIISEPTRRQPAKKMLAWLAALAPETQFLSVLSLGEIRQGIERHVSSNRQDELRRWLARDLSDWFGDRILPISVAVADRWGRLQAASARTLPAIDALIAATALHHDLKLVTRNEKDFQIPDLIVINPWQL